MRVHQTAALASLALALFSGVAFAGPCTDRIAQHQAAYDASLNTKAAEGPTAPQSTQATLHHQPSLDSVARAEANVGDISHKQADAFADAMKRARAADEAGDLPACEKALQDGSAALGAN